MKLTHKIFALIAVSVSALVTIAVVSNLHSARQLVFHTLVQDASTVRQHIQSALLAEQVFIQSGQKQDAVFAALSLAHKAANDISTVHLPDMSMVEKLVETIEEFRVTFKILAENDAQERHFLTLLESALEKFFSLKEQTNFVPSDLKNGEVGEIFNITTQQYFHSAVQKATTHIFRFEGLINRELVRESHSKDFLKNLLKETAQIKHQSSSVSFYARQLGFPNYVKLADQLIEVSRTLPTMAKKFQSIHDTHEHQQHKLEDLDTSILAETTAIQNIAEDTRTREGELAQQILWSGQSLVALFLLIGGSVLARSIISPLKLLTSAVENMHTAQYGSSVDMDFELEDGLVKTATAKQNELGVLARRFLEMRAAILKAHDDLEIQVEERTQTLREEVVERRYAEDALRISEERFRDIANSTSDWIWETGPDLKFKFVSNRFYEVTGIAPEKVIGKTRWEIASSETITQNLDGWRRHQKDMEDHRNIHDFEYAIDYKDGRHFYVSISGMPYFDEDGEFLGYRGAGRDVTQRRLTEKALRRAKDAANNANNAKSEFLSSMSHELRTPMNGILGFAQLLKYTPTSPLDDSQTEYTDLIIKSGEHLLGLINEVLDLAKIESGNIALSIEPVNLVDIAASCADLISPLTDPHAITIINTITNEQNLPMVMGDHGRLVQIAVNLASNAVKYNREGGTVTFSAEHLASERVRFCVTDTGQGIAEEDLKELFLPFNRLHAERSDVEGTGIGLTITQHLVELMGGLIGVESTLGSGSTFWIELSTGKAASLPSTNKLESDDFTDRKDWLKLAQGLSAAKLLYIEDNPTNMNLMDAVMRQLPNITYITALNGEKGIERALQDQPDVILLDLNLPGISGHDVFNTLKGFESCCRIPVIALSARAMADDLKTTHEMGFHAHLTKPIDLHKLFETLDGLLSTPTDRLSSQG